MRPPTCPHHAKRDLLVLLSTARSPPVRRPSAAVLRSPAPKKGDCARKHGGESEREKGTKKEKRWLKPYPSPSSPIPPHPLPSHSIPSYPIPSLPLAHNCNRIIFCFDPVVFLRWKILHLFFLGLHGRGAVSLVGRVVSCSPSSALLHFVLTIHSQHLTCTVFLFFLYFLFFSLFFFFFSLPFSLFFSTVPS